MDSVPGARQAAPSSSALPTPSGKVRPPGDPDSLVQTFAALRSYIALALHSGGGNPPLALAAPAGVGLGRDGDRSHAVPFPKQIRDDPASIPLCRSLRSSRSSSARRRAQPMSRARMARSRLPIKNLRVRRVEQIFGLFLRQPVPYPVAAALNPATRPTARLWPGRVSR